MIDRCDAKLTARSRVRVPTRPLASQGSSLSLSLRYRACHVDGCKPLRKESKKSRGGRVFQAPGGASRFTSKTTIQCDAHIKHHNAAGRHGKPKGKAALRWLLSAFPQRERELASLWGKSSTRTGCAGCAGCVDGWEEWFHAKNTHAHAWCMSIGLEGQRDNWHASNTQTPLQK